MIVILTKRTREKRPGTRRPASRPGCSGGAEGGTCPAARLVRHLERGVEGAGDLSGCMVGRGPGMVGMHGREGDPAGHPARRVQGGCIEGEGRGAPARLRYQGAPGNFQGCNHTRVPEIIQ